MIESKKDYYFYLKCDEIARFKQEVSKWKKFTAGDCWKFNVLLRKMEYNHNCRNNRFLKKAFEVIYKLKMKRISRRTGWYVGINVFGPGLCIAHYGPVIVNGEARFGANCKLQAMVNIGASGGSKAAPHGGDNIYFGPGAKVFGNISLGSNIAIGANAVVNHSFQESNITLGGIPATVISPKGSESIIIDTIKYLNGKNQ